MKRERGATRPNLRLALLVCTCVELGLAAYHLEHQMSSPDRILIDFRVVIIVESCLGFCFETCRVRMKIFYHLE